MFRGNPAAIRAVLKQWDGPRGMRRYYYDHWDRFLSQEDVDRYTASHGVSPLDEDVGVKVYFEEDGTLVVSNCHDEGVRALLEERMKGWHDWAVSQYRMKNSGYPDVLDLITPHMTEFRPGMYRVSYKGRVDVFDRGYREVLDQGVFVWVSFTTGAFSVNTGRPRLDAIVGEIMRDGGRDANLVDLSPLFDRRAVQTAT